MKRIINLGRKKQASRDLEQFKNKHYEAIDIEFTNVHLLKLNAIIGFKFFSKNSLYVRSSTLWEVMQPVGKKGKHHYHGLEPKEIVDSLASILDSFLIYETYPKRYAVLVSGNEKYQNIAIVIELNAGLSNDRNANVNKLVTISPKDNLDKKISHISVDKIIYKKMRTERGTNRHTLDSQPHYTTTLKKNH